MVSLLAIGLLASTTAWAQDTEPAKTDTEPEESKETEEANPAESEDPPESPTANTEDAEEQPVEEPTPTETPVEEPSTPVVQPSTTAEADAPAPVLFKLDRMPPKFSYDFAIHASFGDVTYFRTQVPPWVGFGFRGAWGRNFGVGRVGFQVTAAIEGPVPIHYSASLEPAASIDYIRNNILIGGSLGVSAMLHAELGKTETEYTPGVAPALGLRIGWSQSWTRVGRRVFVVLEPKVRYIDGALGPTVSVVVGAGRGK